MRTSFSLIFPAIFSSFFLPAAAAWLASVSVQCRGSVAIHLRFVARFACATTYRGPLEPVLGAPHSRMSTREETLRYSAHGLTIKLPSWGFHFSYRGGEVPSAVLPLVW